METIKRYTRYREHDNLGPQSLGTRTASSAYLPISAIIHNRRLLYAREYLIHYFDTFNPSFLFIKGDINPRFSTQDVGQLFTVELPLVLAGIYFLVKNRQKYTFLIIAWLLVSPLGPATARETPHALRMVHILPTYQLIAAFGLLGLYQVIRLKRVLVFVIVSAYLLQFLFYEHMYWFHWAKNYAGQWQYGYKQAVEVIKPVYSEADYIVVSKHLGRPYIYFLLYLAYDPSQYRQTAQIIRDQFYFIEVMGFDKFLFVESVADTKVSGKVIFVTAPGQTPLSATMIAAIQSPDKKTVFEISKATVEK